MTARRAIAGASAVWLWCACGLSPAQARPEITTIPLQQRPAAELATVLQPLLAPHESVSGDGYTLILNVEPARLEQLRATVQTLDRAPRRLRIAVRQLLATEDRLSTGGVVAGRRAQVIGPPDAGSGAELRYRGIGVYGADPQGRQRDSTEQTVVAVEGRPAHIAVGLVVPFDALCEDRYGGRQPCTEYREISTGFDVLARLDADGVTLDIAPQAQQLVADDVTVFQAAQTQLRGPLGQWLELGGEVASSGESRPGVLASTARSGRSERRVVIKVDLLP
jgi:type II secretory pathway component GspD/PulD (secretin)